MDFAQISVLFVVFIIFCSISWHFLEVLGKFSNPRWPHLVVMTLLPCNMASKMRISKGASLDKCYCHSFSIREVGPAPENESKPALGSATAYTFMTMQEKKLLENWGKCYGAKIPRKNDYLLLLKAGSLYNAIPGI